MSRTNETAARQILEVVPLVMRTIRAEMRSRRSAELNIPQFRTLLFLNRSPDASLNAVAEHLGLTPPTVCKMVDGMVRDGLLARQPSPGDRRKVILSLTPQGQAILEQARQGTQSRLVETLASLSPEECNTISAALEILQPLFKS